MKVKRIGSNISEVITSEMVILISYETPVAFYDVIKDKHYSTNKIWSTTTTRHINKWMQGMPYEEVSQAYIDALLGTAIETLGE